MRPRAIQSSLRAAVSYNISMAIPTEIRGQKYISLATFRKNGDAIPTPVWFGEKDDKLYLMTRSDSGKYKRYRLLIRSHCAAPPPGRLDLGPRNYQAQVLAYANTVLLEQEERLHRNQSRSVVGLGFFACFANFAVKLFRCPDTVVSAQFSVVSCPQFAAFFNSLLPFSFRSTTSTLLRGVFIKFSEAKWQSK